MTPIPGEMTTTAHLLKEKQNKKIKIIGILINENLEKINFFRINQRKYISSHCNIT